MMEEFQKIPLGDLVKILDAKRKPITKSDRKPGKHPYYGASGIADYIDDYIFDGTYLLLSEDGDNLKTRNTPIAFIVKGQFWVNNHAHILEANSKNLTEYLCYALQVADVDSFISGSTRPKLTQGDIRKILISTPPLHEQKSIAHILGTLDDKIELNRKMNQTLQGMAQALFKSWFVDFDPVMDNALAANNPIPDELQVMAEKRRSVIASGAKPASPAGRQSHRFIDTNPELAAKFPSSFVFNERLGKWIPEGWELNGINKITKSIRENRKPEEISNSEIYIGLEHIHRKNLFLSQNGYGSDITSNKSAYQKGDILFGKLRPYFHKVCIAPLNGVCSTDILVFRPKKAAYSSFLACILFQDVLIEYVNKKSNGTRMPRANQKDILSYQFALPSYEIMTLFEIQINSKIEKAVNNIEQTKILTKLRDSLLPQLISGKVSVKERIL